jgi:hypothetical protein
MALALGGPMSVFAQDSADIAELKQMIQQMKQQHEQQIQQLEQRIRQAEEKALSAEGKAAAVEEKVQTKPRTGDNSFNPAISLVLQGGYVSYSEDPEHFHFEGMPLGGEAGLHDEGLALWETELTASANVDNLFLRTGYYRLAHPRR